MSQNTTLYAVLNRDGCVVLYPGSPPKRSWQGAWQSTCNLQPVTVIDEEISATLAAIGGDRIAVLAPLQIESILGIDGEINLAVPVSESPETSPEESHEQLSLPG